MTRVTRVFCCNFGSLLQKQCFSCRELANTHLAKELKVFFVSVESLPTSATLWGRTILTTRTETLTKVELNITKRVNMNAVLQFIICFLRNWIAQIIFFHGKNCCPMSLPEHLCLCLCPLHLPSFTLLSLPSGGPRKYSVFYSFVIKITRSCAALAGSVCE